MFNHIDISLPQLERETIDGVRYYKVPTEEELLRLVSITSVTSHFNKEIFVNWRKKVGNEEADRITKAATSRGTDMHTLTEHFLKNEELPKVQPISDFLFKISKQTLKNINNIHALEGSLYSKQLGIAGTVDCIAEYEGELAIIDFKTSKKPKPREWIDHYFVQCMAYGCMLYELTGISVKKLVIIMACENGECVVYEERDKSKYIKLLTEYIRKFVRDKLELYGTEMEPNKELEKVIENKFLTPSRFALEIEKIVAEEKINYIDAIVHYCELNELEVESVTKLVSKPLKEKLKWDATRLNFMKRTSRAKLPL
jgi:genome maintenance exonuclease 1